MSKELTEKWAIITPEKCQEINTMISGYKKKIERLQEQLNEANEVVKEYADSESWNDYYCQYSGNVVDDILFYCSNGWETARDYLKKWGVK